MTPERLAALEAAAADGQGPDDAPVLKLGSAAIDEDQSPVAGRRFTRA
jgi:hypothetical protein